MTLEEIQQQCEALSNEQLLLVVNNKLLYNDKIVSVAYKEMRRRGLSKQEIKEIEKAQRRRARVITGNIHEDVLLWEKVGFFFICIPKIHFWTLRDYRRKGFVLKFWQGQYYSLLGFIFFISCILSGRLLHSFLAGGMIWASSFLLAYILNEYYFRKKIIKYLASRTADPH
jgi:hypothetical protein